jgi:SOS-response transcriptional repressor LexA
MHQLQQRLLGLVNEKNLGQYPLRQIAAMVGEDSPQKIKHHLDQLEKRGLIRIDRAKGLIEKAQKGFVSGFLTSARLLAIPILGSANAGAATFYAESNIEGYLKISSTFVPRRANRKLFALKVNGPSMNRAQIDGKSIDDGDYVIVDGEDRTPRDGEIVLSIIDGMANIKRFHRDKSNRQIALMSDSTSSFAPIYIHEDDDFMINGKIVQVIKKPRSNKH